MRKNLIGLCAGTLFNLFFLMDSNTKNINTINSNLDEPKYQIIVNKSEKRLYFFERNDFYSFDVGIGKKGRETPCMEFVVMNKAKYPPWRPGPRTASEKVMEYLKIHEYVPNNHPLNPLNRYWVGIGGSYGIHDTKGDVGIGERSSVGCIRMRTSDLDKIFPKIQEGMLGKIICGDEKEPLQLLEHYISSRQFSDDEKTKTKPLKNIFCLLFDNGRRTKKGI